MSVDVLLKMGVEYAASLNMVKNLCRVLYVNTYKKNSENELQST